MEEEKDLKTRDELKKYFETGDKPTESQFAELIDSYAHLNEFNFGLSVNASGETVSKYYHFYIAKEAKNSGVGHRIVEDPNEKEPEEIDNYFHILSRKVPYKTLDIEVIGELDIEKYKPKIIIERYKQRKIYPSGFRRPGTYYKEGMNEAAIWNRKSEYAVTANKMVIDIEPIRYFKPTGSGEFKDFAPSGSLNRQGSFKYSMNNKSFTLLRFMLEIDINGMTYRSKPVNAKVILGSSGKSDAINFMFS